VEVLRPPTYDGDVVEAELVDDLVEERRTPEQRLDERHVEVRPGDRDDESGQAGARPDVADAGTLGDRLGQDGGVEDVPVPQPGSLAGADQSAHHALGRQELGVAPGE
jgi:hypothetical protein